MTDVALSADGAPVHFEVAGVVGQFPMLEDTDTFYRLLAETIEEPT